MVCCFEQPHNCIIFFQIVFFIKISMSWDPVPPSSQLYLLESLLILRNNVNVERLYWTNWRILPLLVDHEWAGVQVSMSSWYWHLEIHHNAFQRCFCINVPQYSIMYKIIQVIILRGVRGHYWPKASPRYEQHPALTSQNKKTKHAGDFLQ